MEIELTNHVGTTISGEQIEVGQWIVHIDGVQVGYLPQQDGAWLQAIVPMTDEQKAEVMEAAKDKSRQEIGGIVAPPLPLDDEDEE